MLTIFGKNSGVDAWQGCKNSPAAATESNLKELKWEELEVATKEKKCWDFYTNRYNFYNIMT